MLHQVKQYIYITSSRIKTWFNKQTQPVQIVVMIIGICIIWMSRGLFINHFHGQNFELQGQDSRYQVERYIAQDKDVYLTLGGAIESSEEVILKSEIDGRVLEVLVKDGQFTSKGTKLIKLEARNKNEMLEYAQANYRRAKIEYNAAFKTYERGLISKADLEAKSADLKQAEALFHASQDDLRNTYIVAPFDGVVDKITVHPGDYLQVVGGSSTVGRFINNKAMIAVGWVSERDLNLVKQNADALIKIHNPEMLVPGSVSFVSQIGDKKTKTFRIEVPIQSSDDAPIYSGKLVNIKININRVKSHKIMSSMISLDETGVNIVVKAVENGAAVTKPIQIIDEEDGWVWVSGLPDEVKLVSYGHQYLQSGDKVVL